MLSYSNFLNSILSRNYNFKVNMSNAHDINDVVSLLAELGIAAPSLVICCGGNEKAERRSDR